MNFFIFDSICVDGLLSSERKKHSIVVYVMNEENIQSYSVKLSVLKLEFAVR